MNYRNGFAAAAALLGTSGALAQAYGPGMMWGPGWGMHGLMHVLWWGLAAFAVVMLLRRRYHRDRSGADAPTSDRALDVLRERYARGEIDKTEFEARKRDLQA